MARTQQSPGVMDPQSALGFLGDLVWPQRRRSRQNTDFALEVLVIRDLAKRMPNEISQGQRCLAQYLLFQFGITPDLHRRVFINER